MTAPQSALTWCQCCGGKVKQFARLDSNRSCEDGVRPVFPPSGKTLCYLRCIGCGFIFTTDLNALSDAEMAVIIYNADYVRVDPDLLEARPRFLSGRIAENLQAVSVHPRGLDYGGGNGLFATLMRERGFDITCYDPYFSDATIPSSQFDLVTAFEVMEHSRDPRGTLSAMLELLAEQGAILFTTTLQPRAVTPDWWYIAPRNGHVSLFTETSLIALASSCGAHHLALNDHSHLAWREARSAMARALLDAETAPSVLFYAARRGPAALAHARRMLTMLGIASSASLRQFARAALAGLLGGGPMTSTKT